MHAIDLPGFGSSSKPARAAYDAACFARSVLGFMDAMAIDRAHLVGNSMGGRVAIELGLQRARAACARLSLLAPVDGLPAPAASWSPLVRLLRPELAAIPHRMLGRGASGEQFWSMFARPERLDPAVADIAADEFLPHLPLALRPDRLLRRGPQHLPRGAARAEAASGPASPALEPPALFIWGDSDPPRAGAPSPGTSREAPPARPPGRAARMRPRAPGRVARAAPTASIRDSSSAPPASRAAACSTAFERSPDRRKIRPMPGRARPPLPCAKGGRARTEPSPPLSDPTGRLDGRRLASELAAAGLSPVGAPLAGSRDRVARRIRSA